MRETPVKEDQFPYSRSRAAYLLKQALGRSQQERGLSIRTLGKRLGYKQATVLSHMASGRVPIPIERAPDIARHVDLEVAEFLVAVIEQRLPAAGNILIPYAAQSAAQEGWAAELQAVAGHPLDDLPSEHRDVIKEVVSDRSPRRRWLTLAELPTVEEIRKRRPGFSRRGLSRTDALGILKTLEEEGT